MWDSVQMIVVYEAVYSFFQFGFFFPDILGY